ncbi:hypothetical protein CEK26_009380 [Fusarium fujikuroi]|nr:hypothetical protein CEK27_009401 [Fusarium fujikuroi]QGI82681.1 hypothetical protein CEK25_009410 [Fusarium fujikuroi]QGI96311.1 hypothetical protein CEK26_009380 [Fusarium fujikuroi]
MEGYGVHLVHLRGLGQCRVSRTSPDYPGFFISDHLISNLMSRLNPTSWTFDIDRYLNPFIPSPPWQHIPYPVAYIFGFRRDKPKSIGTILPVIWAFVGIFIALSVIELASERIPSFVERGAPIIVGSFGAGAVLEFYAIESPLAQPRNFFGGQLIAATIGVSIGKLFLLSSNFHSIQWLGGAISCATVTSIMALTKTIHPPAGATGLLAVVDNRLLDLGWFFIPVVLFNCTIMFGVALLVNNIQRAYPVYWWTPEDLRGAKTEAQRESVDEEKGRATEESDSERHERHDGMEIIMKPGGSLVLPQNLFLMQEELQLLEEIANRRSFDNMISANILLAFGLVALDAVAAGPCKPVTTSLAVSSGTSVTVDSTTLVGSTETTAVTVTETETGTATTATSDATLTSDLTTLLTATSDFTTLTTEAATTTTEEATTTTAERPDSTQFNIYPNQGVEASGPLKVRTIPGGSVYFNNPNADYTTGTFVVSGRGKLVNGNQLMCAFFRTGQQYGDIVGCPPSDESDARYSPIDCELGASGQLDCQVQGKFCYYSQDMLTCDARAVYPYFYIESAGSYGYGLILGPNGLNLTPVELAAQPEPTEP